MEAIHLNRFTTPAERASLVQAMEPATVIKVRDNAPHQSMAIKLGSGAKVVHYYDPEIFITRPTPQVLRLIMNWKRKHDL